MDTNEKDKVQEYHMDNIVPNAKVLLVDDNKINRQVFSKLLKSYQLNIHEAESGEECLTILEQQQFDIIFLDYMMPGMNGVETIRAIKAKNLSNGTPVVMLTANAAIGMNDEYRNEGFDAYLCKPIELDELDKVISKYLIKSDCEGESTQFGDGHKLPQIEGYDFEHALDLLLDEDILKDTLEEFYYYLEEVSQKIGELFESIEQDETRALYRIEVHALKSTSATVGAMSLSELAKSLELAAADANIDKVKTLHPVLVDEIEEHRERLVVIMPETEEKLELKSLEAVASYFEMLKRSLATNDYDTADAICEEIDKFKYPSHIQPVVDEVLNHIIHLDADEALNSIAKLKTEGGI